MRPADAPFPIDILVRTPKVFAHRMRIGDYFIREIMEQGRVTTYAVIDEYLMEWMQ